MSGLMLIVVLFLGGMLAGVGITIFITWFVKDGIPFDILMAGHTSPVEFSETRDGENLEVSRVDESSAGIWTTEESLSMATEQGVDNMGGVPTMLTTEDAGVSIPLKFAAYTQWLKEQKDIHDNEELEDRVLDEAKKQGAFKHEKLVEIKENEVLSEDFDPDKGFEDVDLEDVEWKDLDLSINDVDLEKLKGFDMQIPIGSHDPKPAVRLQDFRRFMKQNINPALLRAKLEKAKAKMREKYQGFHLDSSTGFSLFMILLGIGIVAFIVLGGGI